MTTLIYNKYSIILWLGVTKSHKLITNENKGISRVKERNLNEKKNGQVFVTIVVFYILI